MTVKSVIAFYAARNRPQAPRGGLYQRPGKGIVGPGLGANTYQKEYISGGCLQTPSKIACKPVDERRPGMHFDCSRRGDITRVGRSVVAVLSPCEV